MSDTSNERVPLTTIDITAELEIVKKELLSDNEKQLYEINRCVQEFIKRFGMEVKNCQREYKGPLHKRAMPILAKIYKLTYIKILPIGQVPTIAFGAKVSDEIAKLEAELSRLRLLNE